MLAFEVFIFQSMILIGLLRQICSPLISLSQVLPEVHLRYTYQLTGYPP
jgi:hypothetical protein